MGSSVWNQGNVCGFLAVAERQSKRIRGLIRFLSVSHIGKFTLSVQGGTRFCIAYLRFCCVTVVQRTSSTLRSSALHNRKYATQNSFGPQVPGFGGWQGNGMRRTERTPIEVNAANRQKMALGACIPLYAEGRICRCQNSRRECFRLF